MISYDQAKELVGRMHNRTATVEDYLVYLRFEMQEAMKALPPDAKATEIDGWHAGCCALRAYAATFQLERLLCPPDGFTDKVMKAISGAREGAA